LEDERTVTAAAFWHRAVAFFAAHGITPIRRVLTDNGACYRSRTRAAVLAATGPKHKRTRPSTPRTNGNVESTAHPPTRVPTPAATRLSLAFILAGHPTC
jgi:transposase InsO family protein